MISLFTQRQTPTSVSVTYPKMQYMQTKHQQNLDAVIAMYRQSSKAVRSSHLLVRMIDMLYPGVTTSPQRYSEMVDEKVPEVVKTLKLGSAFSQPKFNAPSKIIDNLFHELLYVDTRQQYTFPAWHRCKPLTFTHHNSTRLDYSLLERGINFPSQACIVINPSELLMMYRGWLRYQKLKYGETASTNPTLFVARWVLPTLLHSYYDIAWFNRIAAHLSNTPVDDNHYRLPIVTSDITTYVNDVLTSVSDTLYRKRLTFAEMLAVMPGLNAPTLFDAFTHEPYTPTKYGNTFHLLTTCQYVMELVFINSINYNRANTSYLREIARELRRARVEKWIEPALKTSDLTTIHDTLEYLYYETA